MYIHRALATNLAEWRVGTTNQTDRGPTKWVTHSRTLYIERAHTTVC